MQLIKIMKVVALIICLFSHNFLSAHSVDSLKKLLKQENNPQAITELWYKIGISEYINREGYWDTLYAYAKSTNDKRHQAHAIFQKAMLYRYQNNYTLGIESFTKSLRIYDSIKDYDGIMNCYNAIGAFYFDIDEYEKSFLYYHKSIPYIKLVKSPNRLAELYNGLGMIYYKHIKDYQKALFYQSKALRMYGGINNIQAKISSANSIGAIYDALNEPQKAESYYLESLQFAEETKNDQCIAIALYNLGCSYYERNQFEKAEDYLKKSLDLSTQINDLVGVELCHNDLYKMYKIQKKYHKALEHYIKYDTAKDSIYNKENIEKVVKTEMQYEYEKKEAVQQEQAKEQRNKIILIGIILLIIIVFALLAYVYINKQRKLKQERNTLLLEQKLLRLQMNPHFIFNCLGSIQSFVAINKPLVANQYLASLAVIMRRVLEDTVQEYIPLTTEIDLLQNYLKLHDMLLDDALEYSINVLNGDKEKILVPSMVVQPFVENAIVHGIKKLNDEKGIISIVYDVKDKFIECSITNNGLGFSQTQTDKNKHQSLALQIVTERLAILQNIDKRDVKINIKDLLNDNNHICGTIAILEIPYKVIV